MRVPRMKPRRILAFTAGFVLVASCAVAGPRRQAPPAQQPGIYLTDAELACWALGMFIYNRGLDRDHGVPLSVALHLTRRWDAENGSDPAVRQLHEKWIYLVYQSDALSPADMRHTYETSCLTPPAVQHKSNPTDLKYRY